MTKVSVFILRRVVSVRAPPFPNSIWECYTLVLSSPMTSTWLSGISATGPISLFHRLNYKCNMTLSLRLLSVTEVCFELSKLGVLTVCECTQITCEISFSLRLPQCLVDLDIINMTGSPKACIQLGNISLNAYMFKILRILLEGKRWLFL